MVTALQVHMAVMALQAHMTVMALQARMAVVASLRMPRRAARRRLFRSTPVDPLPPPHGPFSLHIRRQLAL